MRVWQIIKDCIADEHVYCTKEAAAMRLFELVMQAKDGSKLNDLLRIETMEVK